jgi:hypothetical protein
MNLARRVAVLQHDDDLVRRLNHLERENGHGRGYAGRQTGRGLKLLTGHALFEDGRGLGPKRLFLWFRAPEHAQDVLRDVVEVDL